MSNQNDCALVPSQPDEKPIDLGQGEILPVTPMDNLRQRFERHETITTAENVVEGQTLYWREHGLGSEKGGQVDEQVMVKDDEGKWTPIFWREHRPLWRRRNGREQT